MTQVEAKKAESVSTPAAHARCEECRKPWLPVNGGRCSTCGNPTWDWGHEGDGRG